MPKKDKKEKKKKIFPFAQVLQILLGQTAQ